MRELLAAAGRSFLRAFGGSLLVLIPGILAAPDLATTRGLAVAALIASTVAGIRVLQRFIPKLTFITLFPGKYKQYGTFADSFARAFLGSLIITLPGVLSAPDLTTVKSLLTAAIIGAVTVGIKALTKS